MGDAGFGIDQNAMYHMVAEIKAAKDAGAQIGIVIGGGNFFRGVSDAATGMDRTTADYIGMLATVMNAMALHDALNKSGVVARIHSALSVGQVVPPYSNGVAIKQLDNNDVVVFAAGTGNPYFTTDTAASLRALEIKAHIMLKATKVDGVYNKDPVKHKDAVKYTALTYDDALEQRLAVMDTTAVVLCRENNLPMRVFDINDKGALADIVRGENIGTLIQGEKN